MGKLEDILVEILNICKSMGVRVYVGIVLEKARQLMADAKFEGDFKASRAWLDGFCKRHGLNLREGQFLEKERAHAVSPEALGRYFDLLALAISGVAFEDIWMLDEVHVNLLDCGGYKVSLFCAPSPLASTRYSLTLSLYLPHRLYALARMMTRGFPSRNHQNISVLCRVSMPQAAILLLLSCFKVRVPCLASLKVIQKHYWVWIQLVTCHVSSLLRGQ